MSRPSGLDSRNRQFAASRRGPDLLAWSVQGSERKGGLTNCRRCSSLFVRNLRVRTVQGLESDILAACWSPQAARRSS